MLLIVYYQFIFAAFRLAVGLHNEGFHFELIFLTTPIKKNRHQDLVLTPPLALMVEENS